MSNANPERTYSAACGICGNEPLGNSGLCAGCHHRLVGESSLGVAFRRVKPVHVTTRRPAEKRESA